MSPSEFNFLIRLEKKSRKRTQRSGKPFLFNKGWHWRCDSINSMTLPPLHSISQLPKRSRNRTALHTLATSKTESGMKRGQRGGRWWRVTLPVHTCSDRNRIIPLMRRPNTNSTPNKPVTLPRNQLLIRYAVTLHVCTYLNLLEPEFYI